MAGLDAGHAYNTFPLMAGKLVPDEYWAMPGWRNAFENTAAVQLHHRALALSTLGAVGALWLRARSLPLPGPCRALVHGMAAMAGLQACPCSTLALASKTCLKRMLSHRAHLCLARTLLAISRTGVHQDACACEASGQSCANKLYQGMSLTSLAGDLGHSHAADVRAAHPGHRTPSRRADTADACALPAAHAAPGPKCGNGSCREADRSV